MGRRHADLAEKWWPERLQDLQDALAGSFGIPVLFADPAGRPLTACEDLSYFCRVFTRSIPISRPCLECGRAEGIEQQAALSVAAMKLRPLVHVCPLGLLDVALPILSAGQILGHLATAQVNVHHSSGDVDGCPYTVVREAEECAALVGRLPGKSRAELEAAGVGLSVAAWTIGSLASGRRRNERLAARVREQSRLIQEQAVIDPVTAVANRRHFCRALAAEIARARRYGRSLTVAALGIQDFRRANEEFGHDMGDSVLRATAQCLVSNVRETDLVARVGGDELAILLPETARHEAMIALARVRDHVEDLNASGDLPVEVRLAVGIADDITYGVEMLDAALEDARQAQAAGSLIA